MMSISNRILSGIFLYYPYSNPNPDINMKTNTISVVSVRIRSVFIPSTATRPHQHQAKHQPTVSAQVSLHGKLASRDRKALELHDTFGKNRNKWFCSGLPLYMLLPYCMPSIPEYKVRLTWCGFKSIF
jgi:hypothetical protein